MNNHSLHKIIFPHRSKVCFRGVKQTIKVFFLAELGGNEIFLGGYKWWKDEKTSLLMSIFLFFPYSLKLYTLWNWVGIPFPFISFVCCRRYVNREERSFSLSSSCLSPPPGSTIRLGRPSCPWTGPGRPWRMGPARRLSPPPSWWSCKCLLKEA